MNWLLKLLGYRDREYQGDGFSVRIEPIFREDVAVFVQMHSGARLRLDGMRIGRKWEGIEVWIPDEIEAGQVPQIVHDLEIAFGAMRYGYVIARKAHTEVVPETERQAAITELNEMGFDVEILPDGTIRQIPRADAPRHDTETFRKQVPRMMLLMKSVHGRRQHFEILAKSTDS